MKEYRNAAIAPGTFITIILLVMSSCMTQKIDVTERKYNISISEFDSLLSACQSILNSDTAIILEKQNSELLLLMANTIHEEYLFFGKEQDVNQRKVNIELFCESFYLSIDELIKKNYGVFRWDYYFEEFDIWIPSYHNNKSKFSIIND